MAVSPPKPPEAEAFAAGKPTGVVAVLALAGISVSLMQTLVIPLVPNLPEMLDASASDTAWVITVTLLAAAVATPTAGRLGDMYGKRRILLVSIFVMVAGSVVCALSEGLLPMIIGRGLQGASAGVIALGISIMRDELPAERLGSGTALMSASLGIGGALGLPIAAFVAQEGDWHLLFWGSGGLGALAFVLVLTVVSESPVRGGGRFDLVGAVGLSAGLVCLLLGISQGGTWGWGSREIIGLFAAAVVILALWGLWELRRKQPLVDLRSAARRQVLLTNFASVIFGFAMFAVSLVIPQLVQIPEVAGYGMGETILVAGLVMAPNGLIMMAMAPLSGRISTRQGPKVTLMLGAAVVAVGYGLGIVLMSTIWELVLFSCVIGAGIGLAYGAMPMLIMGAVPASETAAANSFNTLVRSLGTSTASAVAGVVLAELTVSIGPAVVPSEDGFRVIMAIGAGAAVLALIIASFLRGKGVAGSSSSRQESAAPRSEQDEARASVPAETRFLRGTVDGVVGPSSAAVTVTAHLVDGTVVGTTVVDGDGSYQLDALPAEPLTLVTVEHPVVHEPVTVGQGHARQHDFDLPTVPRAGARKEPV